MEDVVVVDMVLWKGWRVLILLLVVVVVSKARRIDGQGDQAKEKEEELADADAGSSTRRRKRTEARRLVGKTWRIQGLASCMWPRRVLLNRDLVEVVVVVGVVVSDLERSYA